jgi:hypothetical protein
MLRVGVYAATFGVNFPDKAAQCVAAGVAIQTVPGLAAASATGAGEVDLREAAAALADMAAAGCGLRVVAIHWGHEFEGYPTVPQMAVARALVRAGADVVIGAHAHVTQPAEVLLINGYDGSSSAERAAVAQLPAASRLADVAGPPRKALVLYCLGATRALPGHAECRQLTHTAALSPLWRRQLLLHHVQRAVPRGLASDAAGVAATCGRRALGLAPAHLALVLQ